MPSDVSDARVSKRPPPAGSPPGLKLSDVELPKVVQTPPAPETRRSYRTALTVLLVACFVVVAWIASPLWVGIAFGIVMAFTMQPTFRTLAARLGERRRLAAALLTVG